MKVLVTRPIENANGTLIRLEQLGHSAIHEPLLSVEHLETDVHEGLFDGIILTSSNAVKSLDAHWTLPRLDIPVFTTGDATANAARQIGFDDVRPINGSALDLVQELPDHTQRGWELLYPCAETTAHDLPGLLRERGVACTAWPCYRTIPASHLSEITKSALLAGDIDVVLLYSARTAKCFERLIKDINFPVPRLLALSAEICQSMPKHMRQSCCYPEKPNELELLKLL